MIAFVNKSFIEEEKAFLQVSDLGLQRGYAAFDFFRTKDHVPLFLEDYLNRFFNSAATMHLQPLHGRKQLKEIIYELIRQNNIPDSGIRMIMTGGYAPDNYTPVEPNLVILQQTLELPSKEKFMEGVKIISEEYQRDLPEVKSTNYLMGIWLQKKLKENNASDVLYHLNGNVTEFPRANIFIVNRDETIITPAQNILKGITRMKLLELIKNKYKAEERPIHLDEVKNAAEVFMTSTTKRILPVNQVDNIVIGNGKGGPVTSALNNAFLKMEESFVKSFELSSSHC